MDDPFDLIAGWLAASCAAAVATAVKNSPSEKTGFMRS